MTKNTISYRSLFITFSQRLLTIATTSLLSRQLPAPVCKTCRKHYRYQTMTKTVLICALPFDK